LEALGAYVEDADADSAIAVQRSLFILLTGISDRAAHNVFSFHGRVVVCRILSEARVARAASPIAVNWIADVTQRIAHVLAGFDVPASVNPAIQESAAAMTNDISERDGGNALTVSDLGIFGRPKDCIQLLTVHKAKGREFEAVAIIDAHDGRFPYYKVQHIPDPVERAAQYDEARRVLYVAATRAKRVLMFFTDTTHHMNRPSPFLHEMHLV
jgi:DNA helicase-2/ATP-dependent DNA helicase PcrA